MRRSLIDFWESVAAFRPEILRTDQLRRSRSEARWNKFSQADRYRQSSNEEEPLLQIAAKQLRLDPGEWVWHPCVSERTQMSAFA
jgi:hypothetical protein